MDPLYETEATTSEGRSGESLAPIEHWAYQVESPFRPVHEILEAAVSSSGATRASEAESPWLGADAGSSPTAAHHEHPMANELEAMTRQAFEGSGEGEELEDEDLQEEDEEPEVRDEGPELEEEDEGPELEEEDIDEEEEEEAEEEGEELEDEELEDEEEDLEDESTELEEEEVADLPTADEGREPEAEEASELEDELADQKLEEQMSRASRAGGRPAGAGRSHRPRTRRIIVRRGDTLVIKWQ